MRAAMIDAPGAPRPERRQDIAAIREVTRRAFAAAPHSDGNEAEIVDRLRAAGALTVSLVAQNADGAVIGHVAFSPVTIGARSTSWFGLGPVAVLPDYQRCGVGRRLIEAGLVRLLADNAAGCVVLGDPAYYARFGFAHDPAVTFGGVPPAYFQLLAFGTARPKGAAVYHSAFYGDRDAQG